MKKWIIPFVVIVILVTVLGVLCANPVITCDLELPDGYLAAIKSQSEGLYASTLPLVPWHVRVDAYTDETVYYTIHYFPFGSVGMSYREGDGYNIEKPLSRLT